MTGGSFMRLLGHRVGLAPGTPLISLLSLVHSLVCSRVSPGSRAYIGSRATQVAVPPYNLHSTPYILQPTTYTLHPMPYTLHPPHYTLHPTPYTLHPQPSPLNTAPGGASCAGGSSTVGG